MTARAQACEVDHFRALGAVGVIAKPFDPMTLSASVRSYVSPARDPMDDLRAGFLLSGQEGRGNAFRAAPDTERWCPDKGHA